jgi:hypothetical protein
MFWGSEFSSTSATAVDAFVAVEGTHYRRRCRVPSRRLWSEWVAEVAEVIEMGFVLVSLLDTVRY